MKWPEFLGIDTSNYTTSAAVFKSESGEILQSKKLLPVKAGQVGLRQSDALFHHVNQLTEVAKGLLEGLENLEAVGVSAFPRNISGSYMPCFLAGKTVAELIAAVSGAKLYYTSHQIGHVAAALYSCRRLDLLHEPFIAFHFSGGTTDCLYCTPDKEEIIDAKLFSSSLDLKAGQAVDRVGLMLGLDFPCGKALEKLALQSVKKFKVKAVVKEGNCCLSGLENLCKKMLDNGEGKEDTAKFCLEYIHSAIKNMTIYAQKKFGETPVVFAGGVMSNTIIRKKLENDFEAYFAEPDFSCDNAAGTAVYAAIKEKLI